MNIAMDNTGRLFIAVWVAGKTEWTMLPLAGYRKLEDPVITHTIVNRPCWAIDMYYTTPRELAEVCCATD